MLLFKWIIIHLNSENVKNGIACTGTSGANLVAETMLEDDGNGVCSRWCWWRLTGGWLGRWSVAVESGDSSYSFFFFPVQRRPPLVFFLFSFPVFLSQRFLVWLLGWRRWSAGDGVGSAGAVMMENGSGSSPVLKKSPPCLFFSFIYVAVGLTWDPFWRPPLTETKKTVIVACSTWNPVWRFPLTKMKYEVPSGDLLNIEIRDLFWRSPLTNNL